MPILFRCFKYIGIHNPRPDYKYAKMFAGISF